MANSFQLIEKYMTNAVDTVFKAESKTAILENGQKYMDLNFKEAGYVKIMSLLMDGLSDYYRVNKDVNDDNYSHYRDGSADGYEVGDAEGTWEIFKLNYDRGKQFQVDDMDNEESAALVIGNLLTEFLRTKVVPEVDAIRFSKMAEKTSLTLGNLIINKTISENAIIKDFNTGYEWLSEHEVPAEEQVIFVNPSTMTLIRNTEELKKYLGQADFKNGDITFTVKTYEGRPIIEVPSNRFFTKVKTGKNGYYASSDSKIINYMIVSKKAIVPIVKLKKSKIWTPEVVQDFDGYKVNFRLYHDVIVPKNKIPGIYVSVGTVNATTKSNLLSVNVSKTTSGYKLIEYFTNPAGLMGKIVYSKTALTLGEKYTAGATNKVITVGEEFTKIDSESSGYFSLVDSKGIVLANSSSVTLPSQ